MWNWKCSLNKCCQVLCSQRYLWLLLNDLRKSLEIICYLSGRVLFEFPETCAKTRQIQSKRVTEICCFNWREEAFVACYKPAPALLPGIWLASLVIYHVSMIMFSVLLCQPYDLMLKSSCLKCGVSFLPLLLPLSLCFFINDVTWCKFNLLNNVFTHCMACGQVLKLTLLSGSAWG